MSISCARRLVLASFIVLISPWAAAQDNVFNPDPVDEQGPGFDLPAATTFEPSGNPGIVLGEPDDGEFSEAGPIGETEMAPFSNVVINGQDMGPEWGQLYRVPAGRYWYDRVSGFWGLEGQPVAGQIPPGLDLGGPLSSDASAGNSEVFVNGRRLTAVEVSYLQQRFGTVMPGHYWVNALLYGGIEGQPVSFYLGGGASDPGTGSNTRSVFGDIMSDGNCTFIGLQGGTSVSAGGC